MKLAKYLEARGESAEAFARRSGLNRATVGVIVRGTSIPRTDTALAIVKASREEPAPDGGTVTFEDLVVGERDQNRTRRKK